MRWLISTSRWITVPILLVLAAAFGAFGVWIGTLVQYPMEIMAPLMEFFLACGVACLAAIAHLFIRNIFLAASVPTALYFIPAEGRIALIDFDAFISLFIVGEAVQIFLVSLAVGLPFYLTRRRLVPPAV